MALRLLLLGGVLLTSGGLVAQAVDVRENSSPVDSEVLTGAFPSTLSAKVSEGYRIVDLEYRGTNTLLGPRFDAVLVRNTGSYATGWWYYTNLTAAQVASNLNANSARLIDLEPYEDGLGNLRFACVMVDNTGSNQKAWWWYYNTTTSGLTTQINANNARLVDLDRYTLGATTYYSGVMIANTGADQRGWWWYTNATAAQITSNLNTNQAQLYDLERRENGNWDCIMLRDPAPQAWYWWYDATREDVDLLVGNHGVRVIDLEAYGTPNGVRYAFIANNNSNALTTTISSLMRGQTNGSVGAWMERVNGSSVVDLNSRRVFEPASTMKTLHHVHAMRRIHLGLVGETQPITVFSGYQPAGSSCPADSGPFQELLVTSLRRMMEDSDNARTQAVRAYFGEANLNATAAAIGMVDTASRHRLGCGAEAIANPNQITLRDLHALHETVANGYLGSRRDQFYDLMNDNLADLGLANLIISEGQALNLPSYSVTAFRNLARLAHKGGNYGLSNGGPSYYHRCEFGWLSLPAISGNSVVQREYTFGAFVNDASSDTAARDAIYSRALPEMFRSVVRSALQTWVGNLASVASIGAGCGSPNPLQQTVSGMPYFGSTVAYVLDHGFPNSLAVLGIGFSTSSWNGVPLPAQLAPFGGQPGCSAYTDIALSEVRIGNSVGRSMFGIGIPSNVSFLGFDYLTQGYSFSSAGAFRSSNAYRTTVGF